MHWVADKLTEVRNLSMKSWAAIQHAKSVWMKLRRWKPPFEEDADMVMARAFRRYARCNLSDGFGLLTWWAARWRVRAAS